jgi:hypothetical protein
MTTILRCSIGNVYLLLLGWRTRLRRLLDVEASLRLHFYLASHQQQLKWEPQDEPRLTRVKCPELRSIMCTAGGM